MGFFTSWEIDGETLETVSDFIFWGLQNENIVFIYSKATGACTMMCM